MVWGGTYLPIISGVVPGKYYSVRSGQYLSCLGRHLYCLGAAPVRSEAAPVVYGGGTCPVWGDPQPYICSAKWAAAQCRRGPAMSDERPMGVRPTVEARLSRAPVHVAD